MATRKGTSQHTEKSLEMLVNPDGMLMSIIAKKTKTPPRNAKKQQPTKKTKEHQMSKCKLKGPDFYI